MRLQEVRKPKNSDKKQSMACHYPARRFLHILRIMIRSLSLTAGAISTNSDLILSENNKYVWAEISEVSVTEEMLSHKKDYENIYAFDLYCVEKNVEKYPEIAKSEITLDLDVRNGGNAQTSLGKDYRMFFVQDSGLVPVEIISADETEISFYAENTEIYALFYDPRVYSINFYLGYEDYDDDLDVPYEKAYIRYTGLKYGEVAEEYPAIPVIDGYVFCGWQETTGSGGWTSFSIEQKLRAGECAKSFFGSWMKEEDYKLLGIKLSYNKIRQGSEDNKKVKITFENATLRFDKEQFESRKNLYKELRLTGTTEVKISSVKYIDEHTIELTLSGNSSAKTNASKYYVEIPYWFLISSDLKNRCDSGNKQLNEHGFMKEYFISDNAIDFSSSSKPESGTITTVYYTVTFNSNGGSLIAGQKLQEGKKAAIVFGNTVTNDVAPKIVNDITMLPARFVTESLGAKITWDDGNVLITGKNITLSMRIGDEYAQLNGENVKLECAPFLENDRTYCPMRFICEAFGADVKWDGDSQTVTVTKK